SLAGTPGPHAQPGRDHLPTNQPNAQAQAEPSSGRKQTGRPSDVGKGGEAGWLDLCHVDEAGFAPTLPTCFSWFPQGEQLRVPYEAPQGRRVNAIGAYLSHGPLAGAFTFESYARLPEARTKKGKASRKPLAQQAAEQELGVEEVGVIDSGV